MDATSIPPLSDDVLDQIVTILRQHDVAHAALFGSFARGEASATSDLDILIEFGGEKSLFDLIALKLDLEDATGRQVDVVTRNALHPLMRERVLQEQVPIL